MRFPSTQLAVPLALSACLLHGGARAQGPVMNPFNGHFYEAIPGVIDWDQARIAAGAMSHMGAMGHLATVSDAAENQWLYATLAGMNLDRYWLGGFQDVTSPSYSEPNGGWTWVTGEPWSYTNWFPGEPNNSGGNEDYLAFDHFNGHWNDLPNAWSINNGFIVEYEVGSAMNYCTPAIPNSTGVPGAISLFGSFLVSANDVTLTALDLPPAQFGYFLTSQTQGFSNPPGSNGLLCLGGNIGRYNQPQNIGQGPSFGIQVDLTAVPQPTGLVAVVPGDTWNFQCWYRDIGNTNNFTDAVSVLFQ